MKKTLLLVLSGIAGIAAAQNSPFIAHVYDFKPAPGQFIHSVPEISDDMTHDEALAVVARQLVGDERPGMVSLGAFGGYIIFGFDHSVINIEGEYDFKVYGNSFYADIDAGESGSSEAGIVMVSRDDNGNGIPDDEWFELKGSEWDNPSVIRNFKITYERPSQLSEAESIKWTSNNEQYPSGTVEANQYHLQSYWPAWLGDMTTLEFTGTRLPDNAHDQSGDGSYFIQDFFGWGYADNMPDYINRDGNRIENPDNPGFNIDNAVDASGNSVKLDHIDFIKVYTALNQTCGWQGESSTEVTGARDLHPNAGLGGINAATAEISTQWARLSGSILSVSATAPGRLEIFDMAGCRKLARNVTTGHNTIALNSLTPGIYIARLGNLVTRVILK